MNAHRSAEATPGDRGTAMGRACPDAVAATLRVYQRMFAEDMGLGVADVARLGREVGERLSRFRPALVDEIEGIARGAEQPVDWLLAVNARTELLAGGAVAGAPAECWVVGRSESGELVLGQTWDFHPDLAAARLLWTVEQPDGSWWVTFTEAGVLAKIGMNDRGVALAINFLSSPEDGGVDGVPMHVLARCVLEECGTLDEVEALFTGAPRAASLAATVAARADGRLAAFELSPDAVRVQHPDAAGCITHTNHFLDAPVEAEAPTGNQLNSLRRLEQLDAGLAAGTPLDALLSDTSAASDPIFRRVDPSLPWLTRCATLATIVFDVEAGRMWLRSAADPRAALDEIALPVLRS